MSAIVVGTEDTSGEGEDPWSFLREETVNPGRVVG